MGYDMSGAEEPLAQLGNAVGFDAGAPGIGVVAPFDFALDDEYWRWAGPQTHIYVTRTPYRDVEVSVEMAELVSDLDDVATGGRAVAAARPRAVIYACTSGSFVGGIAGEQRLRAALAAAAGTPAVTTSGALLEALDALQIESVAIGTPYDAAVTERLTIFLAEAGHTVVGGGFLDLHADIARVDTATVRRLAREADDDAAQAVFLSCTNLRTFGVLAELERELGKPVLSANQVSMWAALRVAGLPAAMTGERLFDAGRGGR